MIRERGETRKVSVDALADALQEIRASAGGAKRTGVAKALAREIEPEDQVVVRVELRGPNGRGGLDVRGDGSRAAWTGRLVKKVVEPRRREDEIAALGRALGGGGA